MILIHIEEASSTSHLYIRAQYSEQYSVKYSVQYLIHNSVIFSLYYSAQYSAQYIVEETRRVLFLKL